LNSYTIARIQVRPLNAPLCAPFTISTLSLQQVENVAVRLELADGSIGWGETPTLPPITAEDQAVALNVLTQAAAGLVGRNAGEWRLIARELAGHIPEYPSVRAGLEMALLDAMTRSLKVPLYLFFGGWQRSLITNITIPICAADETERLAVHYRRAAFKTLKIKIGRDIPQDIARLRVIARGCPNCNLVLDANAAYTSEQMLMLLRELRRYRIEPSLLEQPVPREDWDGLGRLAREAGAPVAADESCRSAQDALRIARDGLAQVINIKLAKCGVVEAMAIAAIAKAAGLGLMIGGMVETRLAMGFGAHFAAGLGGFEWVDLDTPLLLAEDPVRGGYRATGPRYDLDVGAPGHGGMLDW
jgi:L-alanine-DL-glutamate epimerase-like enolase superfamily enzyme